MSGLGFTCTTPEVTVAAAATDTVLGILAATNQGIHIQKVKLGFKGVVVTNEPVTVEFIRFTSDGTGTAITEVKSDSDAGETIQSAAKHTYTVEPTGTVVLESFTIHPQGGFIENMPIERPIHVHGGEGWGIRITPDEEAVLIATIECDE